MQFETGGALDAILCAQRKKSVVIHAAVLFSSFFFIFSKLNSITYYFTKSVFKAFIFALLSKTDDVAEPRLQYSTCYFGWATIK